MAASQAAALLDELMGRDRNLAPTEKRAELRWDDSEVCKYFLCAFCPHELFVNTRADLGPCVKLHDDSLRKEYEKSARFQSMGYEEEFYRFLQSLIADVERRIRRGHQRLALNNAQGTPNGNLPTAKEDRIQMLTEKINELVKQVEELGCEGKVEEAQGVMKLCDQLKEEREELETVKPGSANSELEKTMEVCEVCGALLVVGDVQQRIDEHLMGKQHMGYARIRSFVDSKKDEKLKKQQGIDDETEAKLVKEREEREKEREKEREDRKKREEEREKERELEREKERERRREHEKKSRDKDRRRSRSRSRGKRSRSRDKRRSTSRERRRRSRSLSKSRRSGSQEKKSRRSGSNPRPSHSPTKDETDKQDTRSESKEPKEIGEGNTAPVENQTIADTNSTEVAPEDNAPKETTDELKEESKDDGKSSDKKGDRSGSKDRKRDRSRSRDRKRDRSRDRKRDRSRSRDRRSRDGNKRDRSRDRRRDRSRSRDRRRDRSRDRKRERSRSRDRKRERSRSRERRDRSRDRRRDRTRSKDRKRERSRSRDRKRDSSRSRDRKKERSRSKDRKRARSKDRRTRSRSKDTDKTDIPDSSKDNTNGNAEDHHVETEFKQGAGDGPVKTGNEKSSEVDSHVTSEGESRNDD